MSEDLRYLEHKIPRRFVGPAMFDDDLLAQDDAWLSGASCQVPTATSKEPAVARHRLVPTATSKEPAVAPVSRFVCNSSIEICEPPSFAEGTRGRVARGREAETIERRRRDLHKPCILQSGVDGGVGIVRLRAGVELEELLMDPDGNGPLMYLDNGDLGFLSNAGAWGFGSPLTIDLNLNRPHLALSSRQQRRWHKLTSTEREVYLIQTAQHNSQARSRCASGERHWDRAKHDRGKISSGIHAHCRRGIGAPKMEACNAALAGGRR
eukprot:gnl/TRDRNA2_/TRDRNA2_30209_c0_seq1.p1 gnl/TRDRNA2_/TRDRNA2_30209_c0~~gnl/TRDRNA2_/TRDRNA2_30209_c0_seq1.p1  ORF type:complete len:266 (+),score=34.22 gnl/TRDRNA2_/TRDRNA2_30209_c0_seq1:33-830(+)